jgi:hypothetical protein
VGTAASGCPAEDSSAVQGTIATSPFKRVKVGARSLLTKYREEADS